MNPPHRPSSRDHHALPHRSFSAGAVSHGQSSRPASSSLTRPPLCPSPSMQVFPTYDLSLGAGDHHHHNHNGRASSTDRRRTGQPPQAAQGNPAGCDGSDDEKDGSHTRASSTQYDGDSVFSDYDLINDAIQDVLLGSDSDEDDDGDADGGLGLGMPYMCSMLPLTFSQASHRRGTPLTQRRRKMAKKAGSSTSLSTLGTARPRLPQASSSPVLVEDAPLSRSVAPPRDRPKTKRTGLLPPPSVAAPPLLSVVLDLDETLVSARSGAIHVRPFVKDLVDLLQDTQCEIIVWTAGVPRYVNRILHAVGDVCQCAHWFHHIISRHRRWYANDGDCAKDLRLLGRPMDRLLLIENNPVSVLLQPEQAILLEDYTRPDTADQSLRVLASILRRIVASLRASQHSAPTESPLTTRPSLDTASSGTSSSVPPPASPLSLSSGASVVQTLDRELALTAVDFDRSEIERKEHTNPSQELINEEEEEAPRAAVVGMPTAPQERQRLRCRVLQYTPTTCPGERRYGCLAPLM